MRLTLLPAANAALIAWSAMAWAETAPTASAFATQAEALVNTYVTDGRFSGAVLVARDGKPMLREGFGFANREWDAPSGPDTEFRIGSLTKQFTATAILQLAEQGKLKLDDPIGKYDAAAPKAWDGITLAMLLSHRSGIPDYTDIPGFFDGPARLDHTPEQLIALTRGAKLDFPPGSKFKYDNSGYILLGHVIEKASGQSYADYLRTHIFQPLGMLHTGYDDSADLLPHRAAGYTKENGVWRNAPFLSMTVPYAAGSLYSTIDDLLVWDQALYAAKPVKQASLDAMFTDHGDGYGYGYVIANQDGRRVWWHNGGINGFHTYLARYPDQHVTVAVLANLESAPVEKIGAQLARLSFGEAAAQPAQAGTAHPGTEAALRHVIAEFQSGQVNFDEMGTKLADLVRPQMPALKAMFGQFGALQSLSFSGLTPKGADIYQAKFANEAVEFHIKLDDAGKIIGLRFIPG
jgi:CubicO group peptidase (beta-lactamase class C family)